MVGRGLELNARSRSAAAAEEVGRRLSRNDSVGHLVRVFFVLVAGLADTTRKGDAAPLLDHVSRFVCGCVHVWGRLEGDVVARGIRR